MATSAAVELSLRNLRAGIQVFKAAKNFPPDFHAGLYKCQADVLSEGPTEKWWSGTIDDLFRWRAIRPLSKAAFFLVQAALTSAVIFAWRHGPRGNST